MNDRNNNFDFLRLIFAYFVIISHSYSLSGIKECDFLCQITNEQVNFSTIGVKGFFVISGYLIFLSLVRSQSLVDYFWKRILRLYPGLIVVLILTVILSIFIYDSNVPFFKNKSVYTYVPNNLILYHNQYKIDGIFENNPYEYAINGSLWTIPYEFTLYVLLSILIFFKRRNILIKLILLAVFVMLYCVNVCFSSLLQSAKSPVLEHFLDLSIFFVAGSLLAAFEIKTMSYKKIVLFITIIILLASIYTNTYRIFKFIFLPIFFIIIGLIPLQIVNNTLSKIGDLSYGIYIYAYPIQQTLMHFFKFNYLELMVSTFFLSSIFAYLSWNIVEKKALKYKNIFNKLQ